MPLKSRIRSLESKIEPAPSPKEPPTLLNFLEETTLDWQKANHLELLADKLKAVEVGKLDRLMVFLPPRFGKSELISRGLPAWYLGKNPDDRVILTSYGASLAYEFSRIARNRLRDYGNLFGETLAADSKSVTAWNIANHDGGLAAAGVGGPITGKGGDLIIIDDPIKNYAEAHSQKIREKLWNWFQTTLLTRLEPNGAIILVQTRWHREDLAGRLLDKEPAQWEVLRLPVFAEKNDPLGREPGELLWKERFSREEIERKRETQGSRKFAALYQQQPPEETAGALWSSEIINRIEDYPELDRVVIGVDPAVSNKPRSDETGIIVAGKSGSEGYVLEDRSDQFSSREWAQTVNQLFKDYQANLVVAEKNQGGDLVKSNLKTVNPTLPVEDVHAKKRKTLRAEPIASLYESGKVYHVEEFEQLEKQMTTWVQGDPSPDRLDACVYALTELLLGDQSEVIKKSWLRTYQRLPRADEREKYAYFDISENIQFYVNIVVNGRYTLFDHETREYSLENVENTLDQLINTPRMEVIAIEKDVYGDLPDKYLYNKTPVTPTDLGEINTKRIVRLFKNGKIFVPEGFQWSDVNRDLLFKSLEVVRENARTQTTYAVS